ncbi:MAG: adenine phosphoribosyltransferase [Bacteroides sp.]|nr:adenine phosphoribosyltransferase [Bacteroides sp.]
MERIEYLKQQVREVQDFPKEGILFRDLTTLFKDPRSIELATDLLVQRYAGKGITKVVGIESRGFIFGSILAYKLNAGFVPVRKKGKLPAEKLSYTYQLEYGEDSIEIHKDALNPKDKVLLHDDLLATGGTTVAALELIKQLGVTDIKICYLLELDALKGRTKIGPDYEVFSLLKY